MTGLWRRIVYLVRRRAVDTGLEEEIRTHLEMKAERYRRDGLPAPEAESRARRDFGNALRVRERSLAAWGWTWLETALADLVYALRQMAGSPGFTVVALVSLALGIAANTTVFSLIDSIWFRTLPVRAPDELVRVYAWRRPEGASRPGIESFSWPLFDAVRRRATVLTDFAAHYSTAPFQVSAGGESAEIQGAVVSANYFPMLGIEPKLGRFFFPRRTRCTGATRWP